jgi:hypothetical protein
MTPAPLISLDALALRFIAANARRRPKARVPRHGGARWRPFPLDPPGRDARPGPHMGRRAPIPRAEVRFIPIGSFRSALPVEANAPRQYRDAQYAGGAHARLGIPRARRTNSRSRARQGARSTRAYGAPATGGKDAHGRQAISSQAHILTSAGSVLPSASALAPACPSRQHRCSRSRTAHPWAGIRSATPKRGRARASIGWQGGFTKGRPARA